MSKSNRRSFGRRSGSGTITVIEAQVHHSFARNAKLAFYISALVVALLSMTVLADRMHPIIAAILGAFVGTAVGVVAWVLVRLWPIVRLLWWWLPEITLAFIAVYGWTALARHTTLPARLATLVVLVGVPAVVPAIRRRVIALGWCLVVRHRLRVCFAQFIIRNRAGTLPLILWARPTPVGERVWIYLRPGLSESDLQNNLDKIAVACHAMAALVERASQDGKAAYLRVDIKRREVLGARVGSPLPQLVDPDTPAIDRGPADIPTALDLSDVPHVPAPDNAATPTRGNGPKPASANGAKPAPATRSATSAAVTTPAGGGDDDINQWI
jgi:hypothetical protein